MFWCKDGDRKGGSVAYDRGLEVEEALLLHSKDRQSDCGSKFRVHHSTPMTPWANTDLEEVVRGLRQRRANTRDRREGVGPVRSHTHQCTAYPPLTRYAGFLQQNRTARGRKE
eukprot:1090901-Rhodomonas_salina.2